MVLLQALTEGVVWAMNRTTFRSIVLAGRVQRRARYEKVLGDMEIFRSLSAANRSSIADCLVSETYEVGCHPEAYTLLAPAKFPVIILPCISRKNAVQRSREGATS